MKTPFYYWQKDLRKLINKWDLISGAPADEFDSLNHKILSHLNRGADKGEVFNVLRSELISYYGLSPTDNDVEQITEEIFAWWAKQ
jgi:hypothetical protein